MRKSSRHNAPDAGRRIALLGDSGSGKTALVMSLSGREFEPTSSTPGLAHNSLAVDENAVLMDFAGTSSKDVIQKALEKQEPVIMLVVVDFARGTAVEIRECIDRWLSLIPRKSEGRWDSRRFLVASRCDIQSAPNPKRLEELRRQYGFDGAFSTSVMTREGIQELRDAVLDVVREHGDEPDEELACIALVVEKMAESLCHLVARNPRVLEGIEWRDLERVIATALDGLGFSVELTPPAKDGGKDVVANCVVENAEKTFYVEIKHWRNGDRPGPSHVSDFVEVNVRDRTDGGLFLSTSGYTDAVHGRLGEISSQRVRLGNRDKIVSLCQHYVREMQCVWRPLTPLPELLFAETLD